MPRSRERGFFARSASAPPWFTHSRRSTACPSCHMARNLPSGVTAIRVHRKMTLQLARWASSFLSDTILLIRHDRFRGAGGSVSSVDYLDLRRDELVALHAAGDDRVDGPRAQVVVARVHIAWPRRLPASGDPTHGRRRVGRATNGVETRSLTERASLTDSGWL